MNEFSVVTLKKTHLKIGMLQNIISPHPVQNKLRFIGHPDDVVSHSVGQEPAFVDQLDEGQPRVLLQRVLPLLGAQQHHQLHH